MPKYRRVREQGTVFVFKMDDDAPDLLHIYARHLTTIDDALDVWFDDASVEIHNAVHDRFERTNTTLGLYWFWLDQPGKVVMVITCFTIQEGP